MTKTIDGKTIELDEDLGVAEGQEVEVQVRIVQPVRKWGEGILRRAARSPMLRSGIQSCKRFTKNAKGGMI